VKILLSAFAYEPFQGSEPEVGWGWALRLGGLGGVVDDSRDRATEIAGKRRVDVVNALGDALAGVGDPHLNSLLSHGANLRCHEFSWQKKVQRIFGFAS
jgi:hypothetical protein